MLGIERDIAGDHDLLALEVTQQESTDFGAAPRQGKKGVHDGEPYVIEHAQSIRDRKRTLRRVPGRPISLG